MRTPKLTSWTAAAGALLAAAGLVVLIVLAVVSTRPGRGPVPEKAAEGQQAPRSIQDLRREQMTRLRTYRVVDQREGTVAIPIDRAMELVVEEHHRRQGTRASGR